MDHLHLLVADHAKAHHYTRSSLQQCLTDLIEEKYAARLLAAPVAPAPVAPAPRPVAHKPVAHKPAAHKPVARRPVAAARNSKPKRKAKAA